MSSRPTKVAYGKRGAYRYRHSRSSIRCDNGHFGDPIRGVRKECCCMLPMLFFFRSQMNCKTKQKGTAEAGTKSAERGDPPNDAEESVEPQTESEAASERSVPAGWCVHQCR